MFKQYPQRADEDEHSIELLIPYLSYVFKKQNKTLPILPLYVGGLLSKEE